jgi:YspA, cpYpsA-related SLOG family
VTRVLFCGSRNWSDAWAIHETMTTIRHRTPSTLVVVHGAARGADWAASRVARELGVVEEAFPAEWDVYGKAAGPIRNEAMLKSGVDLVVAFKDDFQGIDGRGGTEHMCRIAKRDGVPVWHVYHTDTTASRLHVVVL